MGKILIAPCIVVCLGFVFATHALASGFADTYGISARAIGLGGAFTAVADDYSAAFYNPAGLAQIRENRAYMEYIYASPRIEVKKPDGGDLVTRFSDGTVRTNPTESSAGHGMDLGIPILGLCINVNEALDFKTHCEFGLAFAMPEKNNVMYRIMAYPPDQPHFFRYGDDIDRTYIVAGLGVELLRDLVYVGAGLQGMQYGSGSIYVDGVTIGTSPQDQNVVGQVKQSAQTEYNLLAGVIFTPMDKRLKIGFSYRDEQELEIDPLPTLVTLGNGTIALCMVMGMNAFFSPREYSLGAAYDFGGILVSGEANLQKWGDYRFSPQDRLYFSGTPGFDDTVNYRLGIDLELNKDIDFMLGYCYQPSPVPDQSGRLTNYIDTDKSMFSLGGRYALHIPPFFKQPLRLTGTLQYQKLKRLTVDKTGVTNGVTWVNQESYEVSGDAYAGAISIGMAW